MINSKLKIQNPKRIPNQKSKIYKQRSFNYWLLLGIWCLVLGISHTAYALNLDKIKVYFLEGDYKSAISQGEKILADSTYSSDLDGLYYILGLSYLKDGNFLRASDIFEIIEREFKDSPFKEDARLGLADAYFLRGDYLQAERYCRELINNNPKTKLKAALYYRLSQIGFKKGDTQEAKEYLDKMKQEFPFNLEVKLNQDYSTLSDIYYTVQVGSFTKTTNAKNLCNALINKGYDAYIQEIDAENKKIYRVRVGRLKARPDAAQLEEKLSSEGYPTKIVP